MWSGSSWGSDRAGFALAIATLTTTLPAGAAGAAESRPVPRMVPTVVTTGAPAPATPVSPAATTDAIPPIPVRVTVPIGDASASLTWPLLSWLPPHDPWIAAGLSLGVNGLGQVYNGDWDHAWWAIAPALAYPVAWGVDALTGSSVARTATVVWWTGAKAWSSWDAYHEAERRK
jgi:hypothetical protein